MDDADPRRQQLRPHPRSLETSFIPLPVALFSPFPRSDRVSAFPVHFTAYGDVDNRVRAIAREVFGLKTITWNPGTLRALAHSSTLKLRKLTWLRCAVSQTLKTTLSTSDSSRSRLSRVCFPRFIPLPFLLLLPLSRTDSGPLSSFSFRSPPDEFASRLRGPKSPGLIPLEHVTSVEAVDGSSLSSPCSSPFPSSPLPYFTSPSLTPTRRFSSLHRILPPFPL